MQMHTSYRKLDTDNWASAIRRPILNFLLS